MKPAKTKARMKRKWKLIFCLMENRVMMLPAPNNTPKDSSMMGSGVKNLENESEKTAVM